jgi:hypothetical protein
MIELKKKKLALICLQCGDVITSWYRHHYNVCHCLNATFIDGGDDYCRYGAMEISKTQFVYLTPSKIKRKKIDTIVQELSTMNRYERRQAFVKRKAVILESLRKAVEEKLKELNKTVVNSDSNL